MIDFKYKGWQPYKPKEKILITKQFRKSWSGMKGIKINNGVSIRIFKIDCEYLNFYTENWSNKEIIIHIN